MKGSSDRAGGRRQPSDRRSPRPPPAEPRSGLREPLAHARHALIEWLSHLIVVAGLLLGFHAIELLLHYLGQDNRLLFGRFPLAYLFDAGDAALVIGFLVYGVYSVLNAYRS
jgi:hypothetical protein